MSTTHGQYPEHVREKAIRLVRDGGSMTDVAQACNVSISAVSRWVSKEKAAEAFKQRQTDLANAASTTTDHRDLQSLIQKNRELTERNASLLSDSAEVASLRARLKVTTQALIAAALMLEDVRDGKAK